MTDLLQVSAGSIVIKDTDGTTVFDTDERLFCATNSVSGSAVMGGYTASETFSGAPVRQDVSTLHSLGSINSSADIVRGSFYVTTTDGTGNATARGWFSAGGTYVHQFVGTGAGGSPNSNLVVSCIACYTFLASGGTLYLHERVCMRAAGRTSPGTNSVTFPATTFQYNLLCGTFV